MKSPSRRAPLALLALAACMLAASPASSSTAVNADWGQPDNPQEWWQVSIDPEGDGTYQPQALYFRGDDGGKTPVIFGDNLIPLYVLSCTGPGSCSAAPSPDRLQRYYVHQLDFWNSHWAYRLKRDGREIPARTQSGVQNGTFGGFPLPAGGRVTVSQASAAPAAATAAPAPAESTPAEPPRAPPPAESPPAPADAAAAPAPPPAAAEPPALPADQLARLPEAQKGPSAAPAAQWEFLVANPQYLTVSGFDLLARDRQTSACRNIPSGGGAPVLRDNSRAQQDAEDARGDASAAMDRGTAPGTPAAAPAAPEPSAAPAAPATLREIVERCAALLEPAPARPPRGGPLTVDRAGDGRDRPPRGGDSGGGFLGGLLNGQTMLKLGVASGLGAFIGFALAGPAGIWLGAAAGAGLGLLATFLGG